VILFFGLMEILFDVCFALGDRKGKGYTEFRTMDWKERFRFVMDVARSPAREIYSGAVGIAADRRRSPRLRPPNGPRRSGCLDKRIRNKWRRAL